MRELSNKIRVYRLVTSVDRRLGLHPDDRRSLAELVDVAYAHGDYPALWLIEGLGLRAAQLRAPLDLRYPEGELPRTSLAMLHAGLGLALAVELAEGLGPRPLDAEIDAALDHFEAEARARCQGSYLGAALESLGLVVRVFHDRLRGPIGARVAARSELRDGFWHGVGRGSYFSTRHFLPALARPWRAILDEAPDARARFNMRAGLGWAIAMVNVEQPWITARILARLDPDAREAASVGMVSALQVRAATTPGPLARIWPAPIAERCAAAIDEPPEALGDVFGHARE